MIPKLYTRFFFTGSDLDLQDITQSIGITPTQIRKEYEFPESSIKAGFAKDGWMLKGKIKESWDISDVLDELRLQLWSYCDKIQTVTKKYNAQVTVVVIIEMDDGERPVLDITEKNIHFLSALNAKLALDIYVNYPDED